DWWVALPLTHPTKTGETMPFEPTRRSVLGLAGLATASLALPEAAARAQDAVRRGRPPLKITDVKTILTQPGGRAPRRREGAHQRAGPRGGRLRHARRTPDGRRRGNR